MLLSHPIRFTSSYSFGFLSCLSKLQGKSIEERRPRYLLISTLSNLRFSHELYCEENSPGLFENRRFFTIRRRNSQVIFGIDMSKFGVFLVVGCW